jgi:hypothetical protein
MEEKSTYLAQSLETRQGHISGWGAYAALVDCSGCAVI